MQQNWKCPSAVAQVGSFVLVYIKRAFFFQLHVFPVPPLARTSCGCISLIPQKPHNILVNTDCELKVSLTLHSQFAKKKFCHVITMTAWRVCSYYVCAWCKTMEIFFHIAVEDLCVVRLHHESCFTEK